MSLWVTCNNCKSSFEAPGRCTSCGPDQLVRLNAILEFLRGEGKDKRLRNGEDAARLIEQKFIGEK